MKTGGKQAYFATARITDIVQDPSKAGDFYALVDDFLPFDHAVPFKDADHYYEGGLRKEDVYEQGRLRARCPQHFR
ncbi:hypothetical protein [Ensifer sp. OTU672]|uniref:hypothetical protein n=1 Tax=Ensifer sp. OTU672 TaxID=3043861 RepID=UPI00313D46D3